MENRILKGTENIDDVLEYEIDFDNVNKTLEEFRKNSKKFLEKALK